MELTVTLEKEGLCAEITGEDREEIQNEIVEFSNFLEENADELGISTPHGKRSGTKKTQLDTTTEDGDSDLTDNQQALTPVSRATGISEEELSNEIYVDPDMEDDPELLIGDPESVFGSTNKAKQKPAALMLLYLWEKCYEEEDGINSSRLKETLADSGIDPSSIFNIYDNDFKQSGANNQTISLAHSGRIQAQDEIQDLVESES